MPTPDTDGTGHRARLRERLLTHGGDGLLDHELIEYLLMLTGFGAMGAVLRRQRRRGHAIAAA